MRRGRSGHRFQNTVSKFHSTELEKLKRTFLNTKSKQMISFFTTRENKVTVFLMENIMLNLDCDDLFC
jgi:hypothetical protein